MLKSLLLQILILAYAATGVIGIFAYWPTIKDLYHHKKASANVLSYLLWTSTGFISFLYVTIVDHDLLLDLVIGLQTLACFIILLLSINLRNNN